MSKPQARSAIKFDFFADAARKHKIETLGDPLQVIAWHIDFEGTFEPQLIGKHERRFTGFDDKIVAMYARGMTVREI